MPQVDAVQCIFRGELFLKEIADESKGGVGVILCSGKVCSFHVWPFQRWIGCSCSVVDEKLIVLYIPVSL